MRTEHGSNPSRLMSLKKEPVLKLVHGSEIRKVQVFPASMSVLKQILLDFYGSTDFTVKYEDEEGDFVTIGTDEELRCAQETAKGPSLKLILSAVDRTHRSVPSPQQSSEETKPTESFHRLHHLEDMLTKVPKHALKQAKFDRFLEDLTRSEVSRVMGTPVPLCHPHVTCDGCGQFPLLGIRYKCTVCPNFDFCETCEAQREHGHPFLQIKTPAEESTVELTLDCHGLKKSFKKFFRPGGKSRKYKMQFVRHQTPEEVSLAPGATAIKTWVVRNDGLEAWPPGTLLVFGKGEIAGERREVTSAAPGEEVSVSTVLTAPLTEGRYHSIFRFLSPKSKKFGQKLKVFVRVDSRLSPDFQLKVSQLQNMGFQDIEAISTLLEACAGDVSLVAAKLLPQ